MPTPIMTYQVAEDMVRSAVAHLNQGHPPFEVGSVDAAVREAVQVLLVGRLVAAAEQFLAINFTEVQFAWDRELAEALVAGDLHLTESELHELLSEVVEALVNWFDDKLKVRAVTATEEYLEANPHD